jgi:hypothetical protein
MTLSEIAHSRSARRSKDGVAGKRTLHATLMRHPGWSAAAVLLIAFRRWPLKHIMRDNNSMLGSTNTRRI